MYKLQNALLEGNAVEAPTVVGGTAERTKERSQIRHPKILRRRRLHPNAKSGPHGGAEKKRKRCNSSFFTLALCSFTLVRFPKRLLSFVLFINFDFSLNFLWGGEVIFFKNKQSNRKVSWSQYRQVFTLKAGGGQPLTNLRWRTNLILVDLNRVIKKSILVIVRPTFIHFWNRNVLCT